MIKQILVKKMSKRNSKLKSLNNQNVSSNYGKNWRIITIYVIIVALIIEIILKMIVMLMKKENNK